MNNDNYIPRPHDRSLSLYDDQGLVMPAKEMPKELVPPVESAGVRALRVRPLSKNGEKGGIGQQGRDPSPLIHHTATLGFEELHGFLLFNLFNRDPDGRAQTKADVTALQCITRIAFSRSFVFLGILWFFCEDPLGLLSRTYILDDLFRPREGHKQVVNFTALLRLRQNLRQFLDHQPVDFFA